MILMYLERPGKAQKIQVEILLEERGRIKKTWRVPGGLRRSMSNERDRKFQIVNELLQLALLFSHNHLLCEVSWTSIPHTDSPHSHSRAHFLPQSSPREITTRSLHSPSHPSQVCPSEISDVQENA